MMTVFHFLLTPHNFIANSLKFYQMEDFIKKREDFKQTDFCMIQIFDDERKLVKYITIREFNFYI